MISNPGTRRCRGISKIYKSKRRLFVQILSAKRCFYEAKNQDRPHELRAGGGGGAGRLGRGEERGAVLSPRGRAARLRARLRGDRARGGRALRGAGQERLRHRRRDVRPRLRRGLRRIKRRRGRDAGAALRHAGAGGALGLSERRGGLRDLPLPHGRERGLHGGGAGAPARALPRGGGLCRHPARDAGGRKRRGAAL